MIRASLIFSSLYSIFFVSSFSFAQQPHEHIVDVQSVAVQSQQQSGCDEMNSTCANEYTYTFKNDQNIVVGTFVVGDYSQPGILTLAKDGHINVPGGSKLSQLLLTCRESFQLHLVADRLVGMTCDFAFAK